MFVKPVCKFCGHAPCSVDAAICPRCGHAYPNPGIGTRIDYLVGSAIRAVGLLVPFGVFAGFAWTDFRMVSVAILAIWLVIAVGMVVKALWYALDPTMSIFPIKHS